MKREEIESLENRLEEAIRENETYGTDDDYVLVRRFDVLETIKEVLWRD